MTAEERIEAVARALARLDDFGSDENWEAYSDDAKVVALVTLQSLLEPSEAIWTAWATNPPPFGEAAPSHILSTAINAAIKEHAE